ncbi:glycosyltransferase family 2 protein [Nakamurella alba]|uniref:glycosyltransferase family 2 protein n=1 Tax=Nakamurella alba TaxID=2665158 RepID=UPI0012B8C18F|nr:glycosyltransferase family 2 protein [Nakamurella alba]
MVAVLSYCRPDFLRRLLPLLRDQLVELKRGTEHHRAEILVVDNDPDAGVRTLARDWAVHGVRYVHEPHPGIAAARNRALDTTRDGLLVFIDDDEIPENGWLLALVAAWRRWDCAAVTGPARVEFPHGTDPWVLACGALDQPVRPNGTVVASAATNNLLLDVARIHGLDLRFDEHFGLLGGEDTVFGHTLTRRGATIRWCTEAVVIDPIRTERATRGWMLRRSYRAGTTWSQLQLRVDAHGLPRTGRTWHTRLELLVRGLVRMARGSGRALHGVLVRQVGATATGGIAIASGAGMVLGAVGVTVREYGR